MGLILYIFQISFPSNSFLLMNWKWTTTKQTRKQTGHSQHLSGEHWTRPETWKSKGFGSS